MSTAPQAAPPDAGLPPEMFIPESSLVLGEVIGSGSFAEVRRGTLNGLPVCAKVLRHVAPTCVVAVRPLTVVCPRAAVLPPPVAA